MIAYIIESTDQKSPNREKRLTDVINRLTAKPLDDAYFNNKSKSSILDLVLVNNNGSLH